MTKFHTEHSFKFLYNPSQAFTFLHKITHSLIVINNP